MAGSSTLVPGDDSICGGEGDDTIYGEAGDDTIGGEVGNDLIIGGEGADVLTGGEGDDEFVYNAGDGADTITDFGTGNTGDIKDGDQTNNDLVDLSGFHNAASLAAVNAAGGDYDTALGMLKADAADGVVDGVIDGVDYSGQIGDINLTIQNNGTAVDNSALTFDNTNVICFARGTMIKTIEGDVAIEDLQQGDLVWTHDNGYQPIRWIGRRKLRAPVLAANPDLLPIRIKAGALGAGAPTRDLLVSPQHRILVNSRIVLRMTGETEILAAARKLVLLDGIDVAHGVSGVEYWHFLFDRHEIVEAKGALSESLFTGPEALKAVSANQRTEILTLFPELADMVTSPKPVRTIPSGRQVRKMAERHKSNHRKPFMA